MGNPWISGRVDLYPATTQGRRPPLGAAPRPCPICGAALDDAQWKTHITGERCTECGAPWCAARRAHRPFCTAK